MNEFEDAKKEYDELDALFAGDGFDDLFNANRFPLMTKEERDEAYIKVLEESRDHFKVVFEQQQKTIERQGRELAALRYQRDMQQCKNRLIEKLERRVAALKNVVRSRRWKLADQWYKQLQKWQKLAFALYEHVPEPDKLPEYIKSEFEIPF